MLLILVLRAFAQTPSVDSAEYVSMARAVCRHMETKADLGAAYYTQLAIMSDAQMKLVSNQKRLAELRHKVHEARLATDFAHEAEALAADATLTRSIYALQDEVDRMQVLVDEMELDARIASNTVTPRDFPRRSLRRRCRESFAATREDTKRALATVIRELEGTLEIALFEQYILPPD